MRRMVEACVFVAVIVGGAWYATVTAWYHHLNPASRRT